MMHDTDLWSAAPVHKKAAVLTIVFTPPGASEEHVVVTKRATRLRNYPGEAALPGGHAEAGESAWETALREAREEIGFDWTQFSTSKVPGGVLPYLSRNRLIVYQCIMRIKRATRLEEIAARIQKSEVDHVYSVPLSAFLQTPETVQLVPMGDCPWYFYRFEIPDETAIVGLTAHILVDAARLITDKPANFKALDTLGFETAGWRELEGRL